MNDIIKNIESAQLKAEVPEFRVGDTVRITTAIVPLFPLWENNYGNKKLERISQSTGSKRKI